MRAQISLEQFAFETALTVRKDAVAVAKPVGLTDSDSTRLVRRKAAWILGKTTFFPKMNNFEIVYFLS